MPPNVAPPTAELAYPVLWLAFALFVWIMAFSEWQRTRNRDYYVIGLAFTILVIRLLFPYLFYAMGQGDSKWVARTFSLLVSSAWENISFAILAGVVIIRMARSQLRFEKILIIYFGFVFLLVLELILVDRIFPYRNFMVWTPFLFTLLNIVILSFAIAACYGLRRAVHHFYRKAFWLFYLNQIVIFYFYIGNPKSVFNYVTNILPIVGASFIVLAVYGSIREEISTKATRLKELDAMKSRFLAVVSHELKTPLTSMKMSYDLLLSEKLGEVTPGQREALDVIKRDSERLIKMIGELLDVSRIERGAFTLDLKSADLTEFIQRVVNEARGSLIKKSSMITLQQPEEPVIIAFDPDKLSQVMINLLQNADRYNRENAEIHVVMSNERHTVIVDVADHGHGIPAKQTSKIFESFIRAASSSLKGGGLGLGLPIAKEIVEAHNGTIRVLKTSKDGTTIRFTLSKALTPSGRDNRKSAVQEKIED